MHRIDGPGNAAGHFTEADAVAGIEPTQHTAKWNEAVQEEILGVTEGAGLPPDDGNNGQLNEALGSILALGTNQICDNGWFRLWQRVGEPSVGAQEQTFDDAASPALLADRWFFDAGSGSSDVTAYMTEFDEGEYVYELGEPTNEFQADFGGLPGRYLTWDQTVGSSATRAPAMWQKLESVQTFAGRIVVLSFVARVASGTLDIIPTLSQYFGALGSASIQHVGSAITVDTTFTRHTYVVTLTPMTGLDARTDSELQWKLEFPDSTAFTLEIFDVRLELGNIPRAARQRRFWEEWYECRQYFQKSWPHYLGPLTGGTATEDYLVGAYGPVWSSTQSAPVLGMVRALDPPVRTTTGVTWWSVEDPPVADKITRDWDGVTGTPVDVASNAHGPNETAPPSLTTTAADDAAHMYAGHFTVEAELPETDRSI